MADEALLLEGREGAGGGERGEARGPLPAQLALARPRQRDAHAARRRPNAGSCGRARAACSLPL
jgi:hypothetical protein